MLGDKIGQFNMLDPFVLREEKPPPEVRGSSFLPIQNTQAGSMPLAIPHYSKIVYKHNYFFSSDLIHKHQQHHLF